MCIRDRVEGLTGLNGSTIQNWVKRGWVAAPVGKRYGRRQLMRIILINMLRDVMKLENIIAIMRYINGSVEDESDDIIPDERLYDHLCAVIAQARRLQTTDAAQIRRLICSRLDDTALAEAYRDVYKRQHQSRLKRIYELSGKRGGAADAPAFFPLLWAVSYTHLDVYKRQEHEHGEAD